MKKTLFAVLSIAGMALAEPVALTLTSPTTNVLDEKNAQFNWSEDTGNLTSWAVTFTVTPELKEGKTALNASDLISTSYVANGGARNIILTSTADGKLSIKQYSGSTVYATSTASYISAGSATTLTFSFVTDVADEYYGFYNNGEAAGTVLGGTYSVTLGDQVVLTYKTSQGGTTNNFVKGQASMWTSSGASNINAIYKFKDFAVSKLDNAIIPEPATATLSLLALCGLAARRRRK